MEILNLSPRKLTKSSFFLRKIIEIIKKGGMVVFPTDTIYGLLADATKKETIEKVFRIKKRIHQKYLPIFVKDLRAAKKIAKISQNEENFLRKVWPGKTTVVLKRKKGIRLYGISEETIALRVPKFSPLNYLLRFLDIPLTATSANISGKVASNNIEEILGQFIKEKNKPDIVVNAGKLPERKPSTIIDLTKRPPKILRM